MARRGSRSRGGKVIDNLRWLGMSGDVNALAAGTVGVAILSSTASRDTIMRTRGQFMAYLDGVQAPGVRINCGVGLWVVPEGTGTTVLGSPLSDPDADWFWYDTFSLAYEEAVANVISLPGADTFRTVVDSKAMRRPGFDTEVQFVMENVTFGSSSAVNAVLSGRILLGN